MHGRRLVLLVALVLAFAWGAAQAQVADPGHVVRPVLVYIQPQVDELYHVKGCASLEAGAATITLPEAKKQGYKPCPVCKPPR